MAPGTPGARVPRWHSQIKGAWLIKIGDTQVFTIVDATMSFAMASASGVPSLTLLFSHPEVRQDISQDGLPIVFLAPFSQHVHDQLNKCWDFTTVADYLWKKPPYDIVEVGDVLNYITRVMKLTRSKLQQEDDWSDWQESEYLQLDQYNAQGMFGKPVPAKDDDAIFHLIWTYTIKAVDGHKKARCVCDGSMRSGMVRVLAKTCANCVNQTRACLFYAVPAAVNLLVFSTNVSNAFAEVPPPKQGFYIQLDRASTNGGSITNVSHYLPCKDTRNHHVYGRNMLTRSYGRSALPLRFMNPVCTLATSTAVASFSCAKLMTLPLLRLMPTHRRFSWTSSRIG